VQDPLEKVAVEFIQIALRCAEAETHSAECDRPKALQHWFGVDAACQHLGEAKILSDGFSECVEAIVAQREP
jgi:hypothetical protein